MRSIVDTMNALRVDGSALVRRVGLTDEDLRDDAHRVPENVLLELLHAGRAETADAFFGLHAGERCGRGTYGFFEYFVGSSATLREGLRRFSALFRVITESARVTYDETRSAGHLILEPRLARHVAEYFAAVVVTTVRRAVGVADVAAEVQFAHARPRELSEHARILRAPVVFGAPQTTITFSAAMLDRGLITADAALGRLLEPLVIAADGRLPAAQDVVERTRTVAIEAVRQRGRVLARVARALGMSERSLQRALAERGTTFHEVLDQMRAELAYRYLADEHREISAISADLGFANASAFHRAFKRWTGVTPLTYRRRARVRLGAA